MATSNDLKVGDTINCADAFEAGRVLCDLANNGITAKIFEGNTITITDVPWKGSVKDQLQKISETICDNFCRYTITCDENCECEWIRRTGSCPIDDLL